MFKQLESQLITHWQVLTFILVIGLALCLRVYKLESVPAGFTVDEASIGYNAYGILTNHRDEWLVRTPLTFKAFGEFKPPLAIYAAAITTAIFGSTHFAIRLPMALAGVLTTLAAFWITRRLTNSVKISLIAMSLVATSPLNLHFSRIAFESSLGVAAVASAVACYLWADYSKRLRFLYPLSFVGFGLAMYTNHATKIIVPLTLGVLLLHSIKVWFKKPAGVIIGTLIFLLLCLPLLNQILNGTGAERFFMVSGISSDRGLKSPLEIVKIIGSHYLAHLQPSLLLFGDTDSYRHGNRIYGVLSYLEFGFLLGALGFWIKTKQLRQHWWLIALIVIAILPAAIGTTIPHPNRIHHLVPWVQIVAAVGTWQVGQTVRPKWRRWWWVMVAIIFVIQLVWQQRVYYRVFGTLAAQDFQYGYQAAVAYANSQEESVDEIFFTSKYDHPYIYLLLYKQMPPMTYHFGGLIKYRLMNIEWQELKAKKRTLIIATPEEIPDSVPATHTIYFPDGSIAFKIIKL